LSKPDGDGLEQTGWTILYMHVETRDRVQPGRLCRPATRLASFVRRRAADATPCTSRALQRRLDPAADRHPFVMAGYVASSDGTASAAG